MGLAIELCNHYTARLDAGKQNGPITGVQQQQATFQLQSSSSLSFCKSSAYRLGTRQSIDAAIRNQTGF